MIPTARCHGTRRLGSRMCVLACLRRVGAFLSYMECLDRVMKLLLQLSCSCVVTTHAMATARAHFGWKMEGHRSAFLGHLAGMKLGKWKVHPFEVLNVSFS